MDWTARLTQAVDYMEDNLEGTVEFERAAELANCSLFHFCRMFEVVAEVSPAEYVRRRRLSKAALDLAAGSVKVIEAALRCGYETPESFTKAFKRAFGITPTEAREGAALEAWPPMQMTVILKGVECMKYRIVEKEAFTLSGVSIRTSQDGGDNMLSIPKFWQESAQSGLVEKLAMQHGPMGMLGICHDYNPADNCFSYSISIEKPLDSNVKLPDGSEDIQVPAATYAVFESIGPMPDAIQAVWKKIYSEWFPGTDYEHAGTPDFEVYPIQADPDCDGSSPDYRSEVWIPIKKKS
ncbi:AraC family transcriptional regulator [Spirochaeta dissipatitropha]